MAEHLRPVKKNGKRNLFCAYYDTCLDYAVKQNWKYWSCYNCPYKWITTPPVEGPFTSDDTILYYSVPKDIYEKII